MTDKKRVPIIVTRQIKELSNVDEANRFLTDGWILLRCYLKTLEHGESAVYVLISPEEIF